MTIHISDWTDLDAVRDDLDGDYELVNDLDSSTAGYSGLGDDWTPIGSPSESFSESFTGTFDGGGHEIRDLVISISRINVGLFGIIGGEVTDLGVVNADVTNTGTDGSESGIFAGRIGGTGAVVERCYATGVVDSSSENDDIGGFCGNSFRTIRDCFVDATVGKAEFQTGGFIGETSGLIERCYAFGSVDAGGGFAGSNGGTIRDSYAAVSGGDDGFVEFGRDETDCYYDTDVGPATTNSDAIGLSTSDMQGLSAGDEMPGLRYVADFSRVVGGDNADADGYPILRRVPVGPQDAAQSAVISDTRIVVNGLSADVVSTADGAVIELTWNDRAANAGYRVYRALGSSATFPDDFTELSTTAPNTDTFQNDDDLLENTYTFRVVAVEDGAESAPTDAVTETIGPPVEGLSASAFDDDGTAVVDLSWTDAVAGSHSFRAYRTTTLDPTFPDDFSVVLAPDANTDAAEDRGVPVEESFVYRLTAVLDGTESAPTAEASAETRPVGPFEISIVSTNSPVGVGAELAVDVEITNQGDFTKETDVAVDLTEQ